MLRWEAWLVIASIGCGKSEPSVSGKGSARPAPADARPGVFAVRECSAETEREWLGHRNELVWRSTPAIDKAYAESGGGYDANELELVTLGDDALALLWNGGPSHVGSKKLAYIWHCTLYLDKADLARDHLLAGGWADQSKRVQLALADQVLLPHMVQSIEGRSDWNPYKPFTPPSAELLPDGRVKRVAWSLADDIGIAAWAYVKVEHVIGADGHVVAPTVVDRYDISRNGYVDDKLLTSCQPDQPPTQEWAYAVHVTRLAKESNGTADADPDRIKFEHLTEDLWILRQPKFPSEMRRYYRHCKDTTNVRELVPEILAGRGWATADAAKRAKLALAIDPLVVDQVTKKPPKWPADHAFKPPTSAPASDGGVRITRWIDVGANAAFDDTFKRYRLTEATYDATGAVTPGRTLDQAN